MAWKHNDKHPGISYKINNIFTNISRVLMNFRGRCHPDMLHSDHQQINKKAKENKMDKIHLASEVFKKQLFKLEL